MFSATKLSNPISRYSTVPLKAAATASRPMPSPFRALLRTPGLCRRLSTTNLPAQTLHDVRHVRIVRPILTTRRARRTATFCLVSALSLWAALDLLPDDDDENPSTEEPLGRETNSAVGNDKGEKPKVGPDLAEEREVKTNGTDGWTGNIRRAVGQLEVHSSRIPKTRPNFLLQADRPGMAGVRASQSKRHPS